MSLYVTVTDKNGEVIEYFDVAAVVVDPGPSMSRICRDGQEDVWIDQDKTVCVVPS